MKNVKIIALFSILCLLVMMPATFAADNETAVAEAVADDTSLSSSFGDNLTKDYYFDANFEISTENGTLDEPYTDLSYAYVKDNSVLHFANGEYVLNQSVNLNNVSIIGQNPENTIIRYDGTGFYVTDKLIIQNVTLMNLAITVNGGELNITNAIFRDSHSGTGGAIYITANSNVNLKNCTFLNNSANTAGAIYSSGAVLNINDCLFINNTANNWGGTIVSVNESKLNIKRSKFINSLSTEDAGRSIYLVKSSLSLNDVEISNLSAPFGAAIISLKSDLNITNLTSVGNIAKFNGGAIYSMYGNINIANSTFSNNTAQNGAAVFLSNLDSAVLSNLVFTGNTASNTAALYIIMDEISLENLTFMDNHAPFNQDCFKTSMPDLNIGNGNFTLINNENQSNQTLPSSYDLRILNQVTPVKDQSNGGNCWAFSIIAALESCILKATGMEFDLSEENVKNLMATYSDYGWQMETNTGGYDKMGMGYLTGWFGPVNESDDAYDPQALLSGVLDSLVHVQNIVFLQRSNYTDNDEIKRAIMNYGAVSTSIYWGGYVKGKNYYYNGESSGANHAVAIVGWDDNYSKSNFKTAPPGDGAWIIKNSWGTGVGDGGYYYVSYYDTRCAPLNRPDTTFTFILNDTIKFDKNYQYDLPGKTDIFLNSSSTLWYKNRFTATDNEYLAAVSTYFDKVTSWDLSIYVNDALKHTQSGISNPGYYTIYLNKILDLDVGDVFEVVFNISVDGEASFPISEAVSLNYKLYSEGISFLSYNGIDWTDLYNLTWQYSTHIYNSQVACIKAFTFLNPIATSISLNCTQYTPSVITAKVLNEYGYAVRIGEVVFNVDGQNITVPIVNGIASLNYTFATLGCKEIAAYYSNNGYLASNATINANITKKKENITLSIVKDGVDAVIYVNLSNSLSDTIYILLNDTQIYEVSVVNGIGSLSLDDLYYGNYSILAYGNSSLYYYDEVHDSFTIDYMRTFIQAIDVEFYYNTSYRYYANLTDRYGNPISNQMIVFDFGEKTFTAETDINGTACVLLDLLPGTYEASIIFNPQDKYLESNLTRNVIINPLSTDISLNATCYNPSTITASVVDQYGNVLGFGDVIFYVEGKSISVPVINDVACLNYTFESLGYKQITAIYECAGYIGFNKTISQNIYIDTVDITLDIVKDVVDVVINVGLSRPIGGVVTVIINGNESHDVNITEGFGKLSLDDLYYGSYAVNASFNDLRYVCENVSDSFTIDYIRTFIQAENIECYFNSTISYSVRLADKFNQSISGKSIIFTVNGANKTATTYENGIAKVSLNLNLGANTITITSNAESIYLKSNETRTANLISTIILGSDTKFTLNSKYEATLLDAMGNPLANMTVSISIGNNAYSVKSNSNGKISLTVRVDPAKYSVKITNPNTGEVKLQSINVVKRITLNKDISIYYGSSTPYKVKVFDDHGNVAKGVRVTFKINGKEYTRVSDANGYASFTVNLAPKTYTIYAVYSGYKVTNKITIKPTIVTKDTAAKSGNVVKFYAKTLDSKGNILKNKVVTFKFKAVTYNIKTNDKGIACLKITEKLKIGKYTIVSTYGKLSVKNTITIT